MNYPYDIVSYIRPSKTFSLEAHFTRATEESPLKIFDNTFSRFVMTVIVNKKAITCNIPVEILSDMTANSKYAHNEYMKNKYERKSSAAGTSPAFTTRFGLGSLKGKTPVDVLLEDKEKGKTILNDQYKFLKDNLEKYPKNQELMDAIKDAVNIDLSTISNVEPSNCQPIAILDIDCRPLVRKKRADGLCFCYEGKIEWDSTRDYPVSVKIKNYYAPAEKGEDGRMKAHPSAKDKSSEIINEFNMSAAEWLNALEEMQSIKNDFKRINRAEAFKLADNGFFENQKKAKEAKEA